MEDYILYDGKYSGEEIDALLSRLEHTDGNGPLQPEIAGTQAVELPYGQYMTVRKQVESDGSVSLIFGVPRGKDGRDGVDGAQGPQGIPGTAAAKGATYTPYVSEAGVISFTNDGGLPNPEPVNIKGPKGDNGDKGEPGPQGTPGVKGDPGESGIVTPISGMFTLSVDEDGNLWAYYNDADAPPKFELDGAGDLDYIIDDAS